MSAIGISWEDWHESVYRAEVANRMAAVDLVLESKRPRGQNGVNMNGTGRFDYVKYDQQAMETQAIAKDMVTTVETFIEKNLASPRAKAIAFTKLEEVYMWIGKAIRDDQIKRNGSAPLDEGRSNS